MGYAYFCVSQTSGDTLTYVPESLPIGNDVDETMPYDVPDSQLVNTPFMKEALAKEAAGCAEALLENESHISIHVI